jgi:Cu2+-exporting ATPase
MVELAIDPSVAAADCFHCGLPVPFGARYVARVDGAERPMCCPGCCAVAQAITDAGLADYYRYRTAVAVPQLDPHDTPIPAALQLFDLSEVQQTFVRAANDGTKEAALMLENITCAACVWLIEKRIGSLPGVRSAEINYATRRARVTWDDQRTRLSAILQAIADIGYGAQPYDAARSDEIYRTERRRALLRLFVAGFGSMQVMMTASAVYFADGDMTSDIEMLMRSASFVLTAPVVFYSAGPFFRNAWRDLRSSRVGMDVPVAFAIAVAFAASVWATLTGAGEVYYDSIAMFVFLLLTARYLQSGAQAKAAQAVEQLARLIPAIAERVPGFPATRSTEPVAVAQLRPGDHVLVRAGSPIPADGRVVEGASRVDEALLTGESRPVVKGAGDVLIGGAVNVASPLVMRVEHVGQHTVLSAIVRLLDRALAEKPRITQLADRVAQHFLLVLLVVVAIAGAIWTMIDPGSAVWIIVSMLVVACPCALSLATPTAITAATGQLAQRGVLLTRGDTLETLAHATHFVFDKTGTLTHGRYELLDVKVVDVTTGPADEQRKQCLAWAAALEATSEHPIANALRDAAPQGGVVHASNVVNHPGAGVEGCIQDRRLRIGSAAFVAELAGDAPPGMMNAADSASIVALGQEASGSTSGWLAVFSLGDPIRDEAGAVIRELLDRGKMVSLVSGDRPEVVQHVAKELGIPHTIADARPQDKLDYVLHQQAVGDAIVMVGDGVNDAPVLAAASVSIAVGRSTDVARASADAVLLKDKLRGVVDAVDAAGRTVTVIRQNLAWAFAYNFAALPLAALGYVTPWMAGVGMALSSLLVVTNALRLTRPARVLHGNRPGQE